MRRGGGEAYMYSLWYFLREFTGYRDPRHNMAQTKPIFLVNYDKLELLNIQF